MLKPTAAATLLVFPAILLAQLQPATTFASLSKGLVLADVERSEFHSRFTNQDYNVYVSLPAGYSHGNQRYPVLYVPDMDEVFLAARIAYASMTLGRELGMGTMLDDFILVGVPLKINGVEDWARKRTFDFTPTHVEQQDKSLGEQFHGEVRSGGAPMFLRTLKEELIPYIESKYRVTADRGLAG